MKVKLKKLSIVCFVISIALYIFNYFFFHYVTCEGITLKKQLKAGKPFVADLIGQLATLFLFSGTITCLINKIVYSEQ